MYPPPTSGTAYEQSGCNKVGYFQTRNKYEKESCLVIEQTNSSIVPYKDAFHRNCCYGQSIENWAWRNGNHICHTEMNGCLSFTAESKNYTYLRLAPYNPTTPTQLWKMDESGRIWESSKLMCVVEKSVFRIGHGYANTQIALDSNRTACISWTFNPILNGFNNQPVCADFNQIKSVAPVRHGYYYNNPLVN